MSIRKPFSKDLYEKHDNAAATRVSAHLGGDWQRHPDQYGVDLYSPSLGEFVEVEVKLVWVTQEFPWATLQIPCRKERLISQVGPDKLAFWILSKDMQRALVASAHTLLGSQKKEVRNKYIAQGEYFWQVPVRECSLVYIGG